MSFKYEICGLNLLSEIELPTLRSRSFEKADLEILKNDDIKIPKKTIEIFNGDQTLYKDVHKNIFQISHPKIYISIKSKQEKDAANSLSGLPLGYLLQNNQFQVLHGSAVAKNNYACSFIGRSGMGKSSLALSLLNKDFKILTEDLCVIKDQHIYNFSDWVKSDANDLLKILKPKARIDIKNDSRKRSLYKLDKKYINNKKAKLHSIYFLDSNKKRSIKRLKLSESFKFLFAHSYRKNDIDSYSLDQITKILEESVCFLYSKDIEKPLEDNTQFLFDHIKEEFSDFIY